MVSPFLVRSVAAGITNPGMLMLRPRSFAIGVVRDACGVSAVRLLGRHSDTEIAHSNLGTYVQK